MYEGKYLDKDRASRDASSNFTRHICRAIANYSIRLDRPVRGLGHVKNDGDCARRIGSRVLCHGGESLILYRADFAGLAA